MKLIHRNFFLHFTGFLITLFYSVCISEAFLEVPSIVREKGCDQCHIFFPKGQTKLPKAPNLSYVGEKFQPSWLEAFLRKPVVIRLGGFQNAPGFLKGRLPLPHVAVTKEEAKNLVKYLLKLKINTEELIIDSKLLSKGQRARAKIKFERDYGCTACHQAINLAGKRRGGISGPSLTDAGNRLNINWIYRWLVNPTAYILKGRMPVYKLEREEAILIVKYISTLKKENLK